MARRETLDTRYSANALRSEHRKGKEHLNCPSGEVKHVVACGRQRNDERQKRCNKLAQA